jgi:hypothetical protein
MMLVRNAPYPDPEPGKKFSPQEDAHLFMLVARYGSAAWAQIACEMPGRNSRQCRERWKHYLSVGFAEAPWTKAEDDLLIQKQQELGPRWTKISHLFQNRSDIQVKSRWLKLTERSRLPIRLPPQPEPAPPPQQDVNVVRVQQPGLALEQFAHFDKVELVWDAPVDGSEETVFRSGSLFSSFDF